MRIIWTDDAVENVETIFAYMSAQLIHGLQIEPFQRMRSTMKPVIDERDKLEAAGGPPERGYDAWKRAKIERGLAQSRDRDAMIPVEQVWRDLSLDR